MQQVLSGWGRLARFVVLLSPSMFDCVWNHGTVDTIHHKQVRHSNQALLQFHIKDAHILCVFLGCNSDVQPGVHVQDARAAGLGAGG